MYTSLYIHVPFCRGKCAYCAFYSEPSSTAAMRQAWLQGLQAEFARFGGDCGPLTSIFVGGGTPSLLTVGEWRQLFALIRKYFVLAQDCEWTCEANPDTLTEELLECWGEGGVNRVSVGIQSFHPELRRTIGRAGKIPQEFPTIFHRFSRNFDLIFNIPGQTLPQWQEDLHRVLEWKPDHVSCYALTLEEGTRLAARTPPLSDECFLEFWNSTDDILNSAGIFRYEVSNFAKPGKECRHNRDIWLGGTYLGCGPAASSFDGAVRRTNVSSFSQWFAGAPPELDPLSPDDRAAEILITGLRLLQGWNFVEFEKRTGFNPMRFRQQPIERLVHAGLLEIDHGFLRTTPQGLLFWDSIAEELL